MNTPHPLPLWRLCLRHHNNIRQAQATQPVTQQVKTWSEVGTRGHANGVTLHMHLGIRPSGSEPQPPNQTCPRNEPSTPFSFIYLPQVPPASGMMYDTSNGNDIPIGLHKYREGLTVVAVNHIPVYMSHSIDTTCALFPSHTSEMVGEANVFYKDLLLLCRPS